MRAGDLAARDGWVCWLCEGPIDPDAPAGSPHAGTVDHVVPRSRGGRTEPANVRLAHRRCNGERGNRLPELTWPDRFCAIDAAPLWQALARLSGRSRPGGGELVAVLPTEELAEEAGRWATERATRFLGGTWTAEVVPVGGTGAAAVRLRVGGPTAHPGRPLAPEGGRRGRRGGRRA